MQQMFLCYHSKDRGEVDALAQAMRMHGIAVWLDHERGFAAGDNVQSEARRVIADADETFGFLIYVTPETLTREFILRIELDEALRRKGRDPDYVLMAVPRQLTFAQLSRLSISAIGDDLTAFHSKGIAFPEHDGDRPPELLHPQFGEIADMVLRKRLMLLRQRRGAAACVGINLCTRDYLPPSSDDLVDINGTLLFPVGAANTEAWTQLWIGLQDVKKAVRETFSVVPVRVRGSKHLTAAFLVGHAFPSPTVTAIHVQQGPDLWSSACPPADLTPFAARLVDGTVGSSDLFVEVTATERAVRPAVQRFVARRGAVPFAYLRFEPVEGLQHTAIDNALACAMARQVRTELTRAVDRRGIRQIHLFAAVPQGLMLLMGHHLNATVPIQLYEYDGYGYRPSFRVGSEASP